ncbi:hypothetical protein [Noviherbaspirillum malthae]|uniref:hypothetical protein n=1 Tax=Noviherbaspirillum malthae TaxID=1260987 RepID=UPI00188DFFB2|nr:hypothetical protein [Noviherbaspirillum malthae]
MRDAGYTADSPTVLLRQFNQRCEVGQSPSVHAVRKWLLGLAIPTQDKLRVLADWLGVSAEWLRFGQEQASDSRHDATGALVHADSSDSALLDAFHRLDAKNQEIVFQLVQSLTKASRKTDPAAYRPDYKQAAERCSPALEAQMRKRSRKTGAVVQPT